MAGLLTLGVIDFGGQITLCDGGRGSGGRALGLTLGSERQDLREAGNWTSEAPILLLSCPRRRAPAQSCKGRARPREAGSWLPITGFAPSRQETYVEFPGNSA